MGSRDHSYECDDCGEMRGGMNDYVCSCGPLPTLSAELVASLLMDDDEFAAMCAWRRTLAANLAVGGALCAAYADGYAAGYHAGDRPWPPSGDWRPNLDGRAAPGWER